MVEKSPPDGMLLTTFLDKNYDWAQEPHLYIVLQIPQALQNPAYRCGAAGTQLIKDGDTAFKSSESSQRGLQGRMRERLRAAATCAAAQGAARLRARVRTTEV